MGISYTGNVLYVRKRGLSEENLNYATPPHRSDTHDAAG